MDKFKLELHLINELVNEKIILDDKIEAGKATAEDHERLNNICDILYNLLEADD